MIRRGTLEAWILALTSARLAYAIYNYTTSGVAEAQTLTALTALALLHEYRHHSNDSGASNAGYNTRHAGSEGTALGALALPWTFAGLLALINPGTIHFYTPGTGTGLQSLTASGFPLYALRCTLAASCTILASLLLRQHVLGIDRAQRRLHREAAVDPSSKSDRAAVSICNSADPRNVAVQRGLQPHHRPPPASQLPGSSPAAAMGEAENGEPDGRMLSAVRKSAICAVMQLGTAALLIALLTIACIQIHSQVQMRVDSEESSTVWWGVYGGGGVALVAVLSTLLLHLLLDCLPRCFTIGEAMVVAEALALLAWDSAHLALNTPLLPPPSETNSGAASVWSSLRSESGTFVELLSTGCILAAVPLVVLLRRSVQPARVNWLMLGSVVAAASAAVAQPALWAVRFALSDSDRRAMLGYWVVLLAVSLPAMHALAAARHLPTIIIRKGYHLLAAALFTPALVLQPQLLGVALGAALALMIAAEVVRLGHVPVIGISLDRFMMSFTDARDTGPLLVSHFSLLTGCAVPVWLAASGRVEGGGEACLGVPAAAFAGVMALGVADAAASAIGIRYGRRPICTGSSKTLEGTVGGICCTLAAWWCLFACCGCSVGMTVEGLVQDNKTSAGITWLGVITATAAACLLEAATTQLDNIFVPLQYFALLCAAAAHTAGR